MFILFKLLGNSGRGHLKVVGDFKDLFLKILSEILSQITGKNGCVGLGGGLFISSSFPTLLCFRADLTVDVD